MNQCKKLLIENVSYNKNINVRSSSFFWLAKEVYIQNQKNDFQSLKNKIYNRNINFLSELNERLYGSEHCDIMKCDMGTSRDYRNYRTTYNTLMKEFSPKDCSSKK
jgi:hypothetical protein